MLNQNEIEYIKILLDEVGLYIQTPIALFNDNLSCKHTVETGGDFSRNRHYRNRINLIIRSIDDGLVKIKYINTKQMLADLLTKPLSGPDLNVFYSLINLK